MDGKFDGFCWLFKEFVGGVNCLFLMGLFFYIIWILGIGFFYEFGVLVVECFCVFVILEFWEGFNWFFGGVKENIFLVLWVKKGFIIFCGNWGIFWWIVFGELKENILVDIFFCLVFMCFIFVFGSGECRLENGFEWEFWLNFKCWFCVFFFGFVVLYLGL